MVHRKTKPAEVVFPGEFEDRAEPSEDAPVPRAWVNELTRELVEAFIELGRQGVYKRTAALAKGVRPELFEFWIVEGMHPTAPALMQELSVAFPAAQEQRKVKLITIANKAAYSGNGAAAMDLLRMADPLYRNEIVEQDATPPELSQAHRYDLLVQSLREPEGELARAMREAGRLESAPELPVSTSEEP